MFSYLHHNGVIKALVLNTETKAKASGFEAEAKAAAFETEVKTEAVDPEEQGQGSKAAGWLVCRV